MGQEERHGWPREHALSGSSKDKFPDSGVPVRAHYQKIGISIRYMSLKHLTNLTTFSIDFIEDHLETVSS